MSLLQKCTCIWGGWLWRAEETYPGYHATRWVFLQWSYWVLLESSVWVRNQLELSSAWLRRWLSMTSEGLQVFSFALLVAMDLRQGLSLNSWWLVSFHPSVLNEQFLNHPSKAATDRHKTHWPQCCISFHRPVYILRLHFSDLFQYIFSKQKNTFKWSQQASGKCLTEW